MNLKEIMVNDMIQVQKHKFCMISFIYVAPIKIELIEVETSVVVNRDGG
jgi:hypothetical protein